MSTRVDCRPEGQRVKSGSASLVPWLPLRLLGLGDLHKPGVSQWTVGGSSPEGRTLGLWFSGIHRVSPGVPGHKNTPRLKMVTKHVYKKTFLFLVFQELSFSASKQQFLKC